MQYTTDPILKKRIAARFDRALDTYDAAAHVQHDIVRRVAALMCDKVNSGETWCDLGSGSATLFEHMRKLKHEQNQNNTLDNTRFMCVDLSTAALKRALELKRANVAVRGDIDFLPLKPKSLNGVSAVSSLQWVACIESVLREVERVLVRGGKFCFAIFVDGSFEEIIYSKKEMGISNFLRLPTLDKLKDIFYNCGFEVSEKNICEFSQTQYFESAMSAFENMNNIGVTASSGKILNRAELKKLCNVYTNSFSKNGQVSLTYKAVIGCGVCKK